MSNKQLTVRGLIIGALGSIVLTMSSMFIALKLSSVPWPIMFVVLVSMFLLKLCGNTNLQEINVTQTAMSAGAMVAGGLAFTIPGIWMLNPEAEVSLAALLTVTLGGVILGLIFTALFRKYFIVTKELPFAMGQAAAEGLEDEDFQHYSQHKSCRLRLCDGNMAFAYADFHRIHNRSCSHRRMVFRRSDRRLRNSDRRRGTGAVEFPDCR